MFNETTIVALVIAFLGALPPTITAFAAWRQSRRAADKSEETDKKADALVLTTERIKEVATETHDGLSKAANGKITDIEKLVAYLMEREKRLDALLARQEEGYTPALPDPTHGEVTRGKKKDKEK